MRAIDVVRLAWGTLSSQPVRAGLMLAAMAIGVAAVVVLTALGEGARRYVVGEFSSLGTHLLIVLPGRTETTGAGPSTFMGQTPRDLTIEDAMALQRSPLVRRIAPLVVGSAPVAWGGRERESVILGSTAELVQVRHWDMAQGRFLPSADPTLASSVCVIGTKIRRELFGAQNALGKWLRIGERRFRVVGVLASEGRSIGMDVEELVIVPVASAQMLFNAPSLFRILVEARSRESMEAARAFIVKTIAERHQGEKDITVITQDAVLATFDRILRALTLTVAGIAAISLAVAGILIMNVMLVAVTQRTAEIGLLKALGANMRVITRLFLTEAALLSGLGALMGVGIGEGSSYLISHLYPALPPGAPLWAILAGLGVAVTTGLAFSALPARRAARLDPVQALSRR